MELRSDLWKETLKPMAQAILSKLKMIKRRIYK